MEAGTIHTLHRLDEHTGSMTSERR
jgi:hypothetical protein